MMHPRSIVFTHDALRSDSRNGNTDKFTGSHSRTSHLDVSQGKIRTWNTSHTDLRPYA